MGSSIHAIPHGIQMYANTNRQEQTQARSPMHTISLKAKLSHHSGPSFKCGSGTGKGANVDLAPGTSI